MLLHLLLFTLCYLSSAKVQQFANIQSAFSGILLLKVLLVYKKTNHKKKEVPNCKQKRQIRLQFDTSFAYLGKQRDFKAISSPFSVSLAALMRHDIEHHIIGSSHRISTNGCQIVDALIHIIIYDTLGRGYALALHREES